MARREELWTVEVGRRIAKLKRTREQIAGLAALAEHARAVRIVKRALKKASEDKIFARSDAYDGYADACDEILAELQKGRA